MPVSIVFNQSLSKPNALTSTALTTTIVPPRMLTELMDMVVSFPVVGSFLWTDTAQHPHPPSPHILLVPDNPYCDLIHSFSVVFGSTPDNCTSWPLSVNETTEVRDKVDIFNGLNTVAAAVDFVATHKISHNARLPYDKRKAIWPRPD